MKGTLDFMIIYKYGNRNPKYPHQIQGWSNLDWASDIDSRKSTSSYVFTLGGGPISWQSYRQATIALSSIEAKYIACALVTKEAMWLRQFMKEIGFTQLGPLIIYYDNQLCIALTKNPQHQQNSKHIEIRHRYLCEKVEHGDIQLSFCPTDEMIVDVLTKVLPKFKHKKCLDLMDIK